MKTSKRLSGDLKSYQAEVIQRIIEISRLSKTEFYRLAIDSYLLQQKERLDEVSIKLPEELLSKIDNPESLGIPLPPGGNNKKRRIKK